MNTADQEFMAKIGNGIDFFTSEMIAKSIRTRCPTGISRVNGKWMINSDVPSSTKGTIAACDIDLDFEHLDMSAYDEDWTVTDGILEEIRCEEERQEDAAAAEEEIKAKEEHRAEEEEDEAN